MLWETASESTQHAQASTLHEALLESAQWCQNHKRQLLTAAGLLGVAGVAFLTDGEGAKATSAAVSELAETPAAAEEFAGQAISHTSTPGAFVRKFLPNDQHTCDRIAVATGMGHNFTPGWDNWVLDTPNSGVVGYTAKFSRNWSDIAVLPKFRGDTRLLADAALGKMRIEGGEWFANGKNLTGFPFLKRLDKAGLIKITSVQDWPDLSPNRLVNVHFTVP